MKSTIAKIGTIKNHHTFIMEIEFLTESLIAFMNTPEINALTNKKNTFKLNSLLILIINDSIRSD